MVQIFIDWYIHTSNFFPHHKHITSEQTDNGAICSYVDLKVSWFKFFTVPYLDIKNIETALRCAFMMFLISKHHTVKSLNQLPFKKITKSYTKTGSRIWVMIKLPCCSKDQKKLLRKNQWAIPWQLRFRYLDINNSICSFK